jgi:electron transport complex protein RnfG
MNKIKFFFSQSWLLIVASLCFGLLIAVTSASLQPRIIQNQKEKLNKLMKNLITDAQIFEAAAEDCIIETADGSIAKTDIYKAFDAEGNPKGYVFIAVGSGFADKIKLVIAIDENCEKCYGYEVLASNETPGFGSKISENYFQSQFQGIPAGNVSLSKTGNSEISDSEIIAITGATVSSQAVTDIFNDYIKSVKSEIKSEGF